MRERGLSRCIIKRNRCDDFSVAGEETDFSVSELGALAGMVDGVFDRGRASEERLGEQSGSGSDNLPPVPAGTDFNNLFACFGLGSQIWILRIAVREVPLRRNSGYHTRHDLLRLVRSFFSCARWSQSETTLALVREEIPEYA
jgi:hypothetical protein